MTHTTILTAQCPATIWLIGSAAQCNKPTGHDGMHEVKILWEVK